MPTIARPLRRILAPVVLLAIAVGSSAPPSLLAQSANPPIRDGADSVTITTTEGTALGFDLRAEIDVLRREWPWAEHRHNARTLIKHDGFRLVLVVLGAGARVQEHESYKHIAVQALSGRTGQRTSSRRSASA